MVAQPPGRGDITRRQFLLGAAGIGAATLLSSGRVPPGEPGRAPVANTPAQVRAALAALGRSTLRTPDTLPHVGLPSGVHAVPGIEHVVVVMMENHSYDNILGMLGRGRGQQPRGDGFRLDARGLPTASNPYANGCLQHAFVMPTTCQLAHQPSQEWAASHIQYDGGRLDGFVISPSGSVAMGYWDRRSLPFTYALASAFPIADRWFSSVLGQTDPNRRYLIAATSAGMTDDIGTPPGGAVADASLALPGNGTIFDRLDAAGVSWTDYCTSWPMGATSELFPVDDATARLHVAPTGEFFPDAAANRLPAVCLVEPDFSTQSQENPQNVVVGEAFLASVVRAVGESPAWRSTLLVITYDEHGGYYDHVPPPPALAPDAIPPMVEPGESTYDGFHRYGFRVPAVVVSPYAKRSGVTSVVHDHTSVLAMIEAVWNLPALTYRDANAHDLTDFLDLPALARRRPTFPELPPLPAAGDTPAALACSTQGSGQIPPPGSVTPPRHRSNR